MISSKMWRATIVVALLLASFGMPGAPAAQAQEPVGTTTITFGGKPLSGSTTEMTEFVLGEGGLRETAAISVPASMFAMGTLIPYVPTAEFGVTEKLSGGSYRLLETRYMTDLSQDRFDAVTPSAGQHGDWPPHLLRWSFASDQPITAGELTSEISWRLRYQPDQAGSLAFSFSLDPSHLEEYGVMSSGGDLGLFVTSSQAVTLTVNGETFVAAGCADCLAYTRALTSTVGAGVYTAEEVAWFGNLSVGEDVSQLTGMYVLPVRKDATEMYSVTISVDSTAVAADPSIFIWFGRFDLP